MSLLIRGMNMPIGRAKIEIGLDAEGNPMAMVGDKVFDVVHVQPHGRLIDADALIEAMARMVPWAITDPTENAFLDGLSAAYEATNAAPTIIPAEEGE